MNLTTLVDCKELISLMLIYETVFSHEYIFLLTKNKKYYYDADAIKEPAKYAGDDRGSRTDNRRGTECNSMSGVTGDKRNKRTVWTITTKPYKGAHYATFPPELPEVCIKAGSSEKGCCPECGAPWKRITKSKTSFEGGSGKAGKQPEDIGGKWGEERHGKNILLGPVVTSKTTGWESTCEHEHEPVPCIILDPFAGSGTTCMVARDLGRSSVGLDLSFDYLVNNAKKRLEIDKLEYWINGGEKESEDDFSGLPMFDDNNIEKEKDHKNLRTPGQQPYSMHLARVNKETE